MVEYSRFVDDIVHEPTQVTEQGIDLTVADIREITTPGRVDFGGGELEPAETTSVDTEKRNPDDEYEWWQLEDGHYLLVYNETLRTDDMKFTLQTRDALLARGACHPTLTITELQSVPLTVGGAGLRIKENARVSTLVAVDPA